MTDADLLILLDKSFHLIRTVECAVHKMGLRDRGADLSLSHEARMLSLAFSEPEGQEQPPGSLVKGSGEATAILAQLKEAYRYVKSNEPVEDRRPSS